MSCFSSEYKFLILNKDLPNSNSFKFLISNRKDSQLNPKIPKKFTE